MRCPVCRASDWVIEAAQNARLRAEIVTLRRQSMGLAEVQTCDTSEGWDE